MDINQYIAFTELLEYPPDYLKLGDVVDPEDITENDMDLVAGDLSVVLNLVLDGCTKFPKHFIDPGITSGMYSYYHISMTPQNSSYDVLSGDVNEIEKILEFSVPAPYGDIALGETVVDNTVRKCMQFTGECRSYINIGSLQMIHQALYPQYKEIYISFNKVNIYGEGGHFKRHVDTPKQGVIGTLLVFGKSNYTGGELVLHLDEGDKIVKNENYCAFHSNVPHCVLPVTSGYRVAVSYYITSKPICKKIAHASDQSDHWDGQTDLCVTATTEPCRANENGHTPELVDHLKRNFGIILYETYAQDEHVLKGSDHILVSRLRSLLPEATIEIHPAIIVYSLKTEYDWSRKLSASVYRLTEDDFNYYRQSKLKPESELKPEPVPNPIHHQVDFYTYRQEAGGQLLHSYDIPYAERVGNEYQEGFLRNVYMNKVVVITQ